MEKLTIRNFAGFKSVEILTSPVTGLIGPQASGKSVIAKLLYFFREIASRMPGAVIDGMDGERYKQECCERFCRYFSIKNTSASKASIAYASNERKIQIKFPAAVAPKLIMEWDGFYDSILKRFSKRFEGRRHRVLRRVKAGDSGEMQNAEEDLREEMDVEISAVLGEWAAFEQIFVPAGRAFFSQFRRSVFSQLESGEDLDPFMVAFGSLIERSKSLLEFAGLYHAVNGQPPLPVRRFGSVRKQLCEILNADLLRYRKEDFLGFPDGRRLSVAQASSGQQEVLPLLLLLAHFAIVAHERGRAVYIEEPEAHLFPATQKLVVDLMAQSFRGRKGGMTLVITTHSPYILTSVNNLLQAGQLYAKASAASAKKLGSIIPKEQILKPGEVGFYALADGQAAPIMDKETGLINGDAIDQVSNDIAVQFGELLAEGHEES
jgi:ABC-type cobalamin/Fe3+-siderophores transport system ATPase subunit